MMTVEAKNIRDLFYVGVVGKLPTTSNQTVLVITCLDKYSRYLVAYPVRNATTAKIIRCLKTYFVRLGVPRTIVVDNGPRFVSHKFVRYLKEQNIRLIHSTPPSRK